METKHQKFFEMCLGAPEYQKGSISDIMIAYHSLVLQNSKKCLKKGLFLPFLENLPILVEYSTGVEYSMGSEKIFGGQDFACLQSLFYRM